MRCWTHSDASAAVRTVLQTPVFSCGRAAARACFRRSGYADVAVSSTIPSFAPRVVPRTPASTSFVVHSTRSPVSSGGPPLWNPVVEVRSPPGERQHVAPGRVVIEQGMAPSAHSAVGGCRRCSVTDCPVLVIVDNGCGAPVVDHGRGVPKRAAFRFHFPLGGGGRWAMDCRRWTGDADVGFDGGDDMHDGQLHARPHQGQQAQSMQSFTAMRQTPSTMQHPFYPTRAASPPTPFGGGCVGQTPESMHAGVARGGPQPWDMRADDGFAVRDHPLPVNQQFDLYAARACVEGTSMAAGFGMPSTPTQSMPMGGRHWSPQCSQGAGRLFGSRCSASPAEGVDTDASWNRPNTRPVSPKTRMESPFDEGTGGSEAGDEDGEAEQGSALPMVASSTGGQSDVSGQGAGGATTVGGRPANGRLPAQSQAMVDAGFKHRSGEECRKKWSNMLATTKLIVEKCEASGQPSYWDLSVEERKEKSLPLSFEKALWDAMQWKLNRPSMRCDNTLASENLAGGGTDATSAGGSDTRCAEDSNNSAKRRRTASGKARNDDAGSSVSSLGRAMEDSTRSYCDGLDKAATTLAKATADAGSAIAARIGDVAEAMRGGNTVLELLVGVLARRGANGVDGGESHRCTDPSWR
ncbi:hypothetical protein CBR_g49665 [Chara braunii]|uniref:Myb-like domain-containing protein n=1 Tax=Chara braunii TaxID=69332 RepID=A0A388M5F3_CHABU|nr:hypothetical protein CBR_g49665 [Chara braunii]|eukprot:GBG89814.1 hypothetical protein CBR_g49665 [Chara braunii]